MRLFTRTNGSIVKKTLAIYKQEAASEKKTIWLFATLIPFSHFLYIVLAPLLISFIIQSLIENPHNTATPLWLVAALLASGILSIFIQHISFIPFFNHEERMTTKLAERAMNGLLRHSHTFFSNQKVGSLAGDINTFSRSYLQLMDTVFLQASNMVVGIVMSLVVIGFIAPLLLIPLLLLTALILGESLYSMQKRAVYRNERKELQSRLFGTIADVLGNQTLVRMFSKTHSEIANIVGERRAIEHVAAKEIDVLQRSAEVRMSILYGFQAITMIVAILLVNNDLVSIAALVFTVSYLGRVTHAMYNINSIIRVTEQAFLDASKITEILDIEPEVKDIPNAKDIVVKDGAIALDAVSFTYESKHNDAVFHKLNLEIPAGQSVGLVGKSGGGKSTLTQLLLRYMDVQAGEITIDKQNIAKVTQESLRGAISYVPQDPYLFHRTLRENIAYGQPSATQKDIIHAAKQAHAWEFIQDLPQGLDTVVGERGVKLSGGQRQRVAIARAILKDAPILVLDEATSALDSESEKYIQLALESLMKNRTSIVIAHRLSTIAKLDCIIVLDEGKIVENGTHVELLENNKLYEKLWNHQSGGFLES